MYANYLWSCSDRREELQEEYSSASLLIPTYAGFGQNERPTYHCIDNTGNNLHKVNALRKATRKQLIIASLTSDRDEAVRREIFMIGFIGRDDLGMGPLTNLTNGGDGVVTAPAVYQKISATKKLLYGTWTPEQREQQMKATRTPEAITKMTDFFVNEPLE